MRPQPREAVESFLEKWTMQKLEFQRNEECIASQKKDDSRSGAMRAN